jgi:hypothetical protein
MVYDRDHYMCLLALFLYRYHNCLRSRTLYRDYNSPRQGLFIAIKMVSDRSSCESDAMDIIGAFIQQNNSLGSST